MSKGKGGGGGSIPSDYTIKVGGTGTTLAVDADLDNIHIKEIAPLTVNSNIAVTKPIVTQSTTDSDSKASIDLKVEPLKVDSDSKSEIDIKPLVVDSCQTLKLAPLPATCVEQPYTHHFGFTFMGIELWGFNVSGTSETAVRSPERSRFHSVHVGHHGHSSEEVPPHDGGGNEGGLRVRIGRT
jgi:hypothetical protein